jgi:paraquat-inducible protein B
MSEPKTNESILDEVPDAVVQTRKRRFSIVWIVPLVAVLIGAWLVYKAFSEKGPTITVTFSTAEGLEAGKTKIKYKDVELGEVEAIRLSSDLSHVVVTAQLVKQAQKFLSENTRFWVVRARVAAGAVSGLGTIFSGAYIGLDPGKPGKPATQFKGLEIPPVVTTDLPGRHFVLQAPRLGSLEIGSPVYYRQIKVGQVVSYNLDEDGKSVTIKVFIHAPNHKQVYKNTRFWNAGGLDVAVDASGIRVNTESFVALMIGGIAFDTPTNLEPGGPAEEEEIFKLYESRESIFEKTYARKTHWLLYFAGSVRGLSEGAPVEFRGIRIGQVVDVKLEMDMKTNAFRIPVLIEIEPDRIGETDKIPSDAERRKIMDHLVSRGLRAQLKTGSLITGQLLVQLDMHPDAPPKHIVWEGNYPEMPTLPTPMEEITASLTQLLNKLEKLPIEQIGKNLNATLDQTKQFSEALNTSVTPELENALHELNSALQYTRQLAQNLNSNVTPSIIATLEQAQTTLETMGSSVSKDSPLYYELKIVLRELAAAARSLRVMADYLEQHPEALIRGKGKQQ